MIGDNLSNHISIEVIRLYEENDICFVLPDPMHWTDSFIKVFQENRLGAK